MKRLLSLAPLAFLLAIFALGCIAAERAHAANGQAANVSQDVATGYRYDAQTTAFRTSITNSGDSSSWATISSSTTGQLKILGKQTVSVSGRFSAASQTCTFRIAYSYTDPVSGTETFMGCSNTFTLTAGTFQDAGSKFVAPSLPLDGAGATTGRIQVVTGPTVGVVDLWVGTY